MNKTDSKIEEQIKHIKEEHSTMGIGYHLDLLSTLIQEERENAYSSGFDDCKKLTDILVGIKKKEAVEGFIDNIGWKKPSEVIDLADDVIDGRSLVKQMEAYLQSLDKGDKITSNTLTIIERII